MQYMTIPKLTNNTNHGKLFYGIPKFSMNVYENRELVKTKVSANLPWLLKVRSKNDNSDKFFNSLHGWPQCNDSNPNVMCEECDCWKHFTTD